MNRSAIGGLPGAALHSAAAVLGLLVEVLVADHAAQVHAPDLAQRIDELTRHNHQLADQLQHATEDNALQSVPWP